MKKKVPKSLQAIIITLLVGMIVPKIADITGVALIDKVIWKVLLSIAFNIATIAVGILFSAKIIRGKTEGGKARITIFLLIVVILLCTISPILMFIVEVSKIVLYVLGGVALLCIVIVIVNYSLSIKDKKMDFVKTQDKSINKPQQSSNTIRKNITQSQQKNIPKQANESTQTINQTITATEMVKLKTIYELWRERDIAKKCLTVTNEENPDLKWVKIYKPPYGDGNFYGYILMQNAKNTVSGQIYFADKAIWTLYKD